MLHGLYEGWSVLPVRRKDWQPRTPKNKTYEKVRKNSKLNTSVETIQFSASSYTHFTGLLLFLISYSWHSA